MNEPLTTDEIDVVREQDRGAPDASEIHRVADALRKVVDDYDSDACGDALGVLCALAEYRERGYVPALLATIAERDAEIARLREEFFATVKGANETIRRTAWLAARRNSESTRAACVEAVGAAGGGFDVAAAVGRVSLPELPDDL